MRIMARGAGPIMNNSAKAWQEVLEEFDSETAFWAQFRLPPVKQAIHFAPWETDVVNHVKDTALRVASTNKIYPHVEGLDDAIGAALHWMKSPPQVLWDGLECLAAGKQLDNLFEVFSHYGDYREHLGVLYAREYDYAAFGSQRACGQLTPQKLKRFVASYMEAVAREEHLDRKNDIALLRGRVEEYAKDIVLQIKPRPVVFSNIDFTDLLKFSPQKELQKERDCYELKPKFLKELTCSTFAEWIDEVLILQIQEYALRP